MLHQMPGGVHGWRGLLGLHPAPTTRSRILEDTTELFQVGALEAFVAAFAAALILPRLLSIAGGLTTRISDQAILASTLAAVVLGPLLVGIVGVGIWRSAFANIALGIPSTPSWPLAVALAAGLTLGLFLGFDDVVALGFNPGGILGVRALWAVLAALVFLGLVRWMKAGARSWLMLALRAESPRAFYVTGLVVSTFVVCSALAALFFVEVMARTFVGTGSASAFSPVVALLFVVQAAGTLFIEQFPLAFFGVLVLVWGFPLLGAYLSGRLKQQPVSHWALLEGTLPVSASPGAVRVGPLARAVAIAAVVQFGIMLLLEVQWRGSSEAYRAAPDNKLAFFESEIRATLLLQACLGFVVVLLVPTARVTHALLVAFVFGWLATAAMHVLLVAFGSTTDPGFVLITASRLVGYGTLVAFVTASGAAIITQWSRRRPAKPFTRSTVTDSTA